MPPLPRKSKIEANRAGGADRDWELAYRFSAIASTVLIAASTLVFLLARPWAKTTFTAIGAEISMCSRWALGLHGWLAFGISLAVVAAIHLLPRRLPRKAAALVAAILGCATVLFYLAALFCLLLPLKPWQESPR